MIEFVFLCFATAAMVETTVVCPLLNQTAVELNRQINTIGTYFGLKFKDQDGVMKEWDYALNANVESVRHTLSKSSELENLNTAAENIFNMMKKEIEETIRLNPGVFECMACMREHSGGLEMLCFSDAPKVFSSKLNFAVMVYNLESIESHYGSNYWSLIFGYNRNKIASQVAEGSEHRNCASGNDNPFVKTMQMFQMANVISIFIDKGCCKLFKFTENRNCMCTLEHEIDVSIPHCWKNLLPEEYFEDFFSILDFFEKIEFDAE